MHKETDRRAIQIVRFGWSWWNGSEMDNLSEETYILSGHVVEPDQ